MVNNYIPKQGDICYVDFDPTKGHEQQGFRPGLVVSQTSFNKVTGMAILCPITSNDKPFVTHVLLKKTKKVKGTVLTEHVRSMDYTARNLKFVEKIDRDELEDILDLLNSIIEID